MAPIEKIAMRIKALRSKRKFTQAALAERAGTSHGYLARLETGRQDLFLGHGRRESRSLGARGVLISSGACPAPLDTRCAEPRQPACRRCRGSQASRVGRSR